MFLHQNQNDISAYLHDIDQVPLLSREEEEYLTKSYGNCCQPHIQQDSSFTICPKCHSIKQTLISSNLRFVVSVAKKYQGNSLSLSDLINEGNIGLVTSVDKFNHTLGYHFISYAVWWIKQSIMKAISEKSRMIRLPVNRTNELFRIAKFADEYSKKHNSTATHHQISEALDIPVCDIKRILDFSQGHTSIETLMNEHGEYNFTSPESPIDPEYSIISESLNSGLVGLLDSLPQRERLILVKRYGLDGEEQLSLSKIGKLVGLTKERIRQLEKQALCSLKKRASEKQLNIYFN